MYTGNDYSILIDYYFSQSFYAIGFYAIHENEGVEDGIRKTFGMPGIGIGYKGGKVFSLELSLFKPNKTIGSDLDLNTFKITTTRLDWLLKVTLCFNWQI